MGRAQTEVIGVVLLVGFVLVAAGSVLVVGSAALGPLEEQSEHEQNVDEAQQIAHEIETLMRSSNGDADIALREGYEVSEDGAEITFIVDGEEQEPIQTGQLERDGIVYEGGLIVDDESGQVIGSPPFELRAGSSHMQFPTLQSESGQFNGELEQTNLDRVPAPNESLEIHIESEFYEQWADEFDNANVSIHESETKVIISYDFSGEYAPENALMMGLSEEGSTLDLNDVPKTYIDSYDGEGEGKFNGIVRVDADQGAPGGNFELRGDLYYDGDISPDNSPNWNVTGKTEQEDVDVPNSTEEMLAEPDDPNYDERDDLKGGIYYTNDLTITDEISVEEDSVLIVDGDLTIKEGELRVLESLDVHVHGSLIIEGNDELIVTEGQSREAERVSMFVKEDIIVNDGSPEITGLLYASDSTLELTRDEITVHGGMVIDDIDAGPGGQEQSALNLHYDERLSDRSSAYAVSDNSGIISNELANYGSTVHTFDIRISEFEAD